MARNRNRSSANTAHLDKVVAPVSLKDQAYLSIKTAILSLDLKPGVPLVESELAQQLGISKTPVRTALQDLERDGLVTKILYKGTYVAGITRRDIREVFQLRAVLEGFGARLAAPVISDDELDRAADLLDSMDAALEGGQRALASKYGTQFHYLILQSADNERLKHIWHNLDDHTQRFRYMSDQISGRLEKSVGEHRRILEALVRRDAELAEQRLREHLQSVLEELSAEQAPEGSGKGEETFS
jgi:DNA-binding GntR family transcriptional regulator